MTPPKPKNPIKSIGYLTREKKHNDINSLHSELSVVNQMSCNDLDLLQWESLVTISDCSVVVCSSVVNHYSSSVHSVVTTPSDLPSVVCSVESSVVCSEVI